MEEKKTADYVMTVGFEAPVAQEGSYIESLDKERSFMLPNLSPVIQTIEEQVFAHWPPKNFRFNTTSITWI
jgi:hypothetical protein